jgi:hypothetical protein
MRQSIRSTKKMMLRLTFRKIPWNLVVEGFPMTFDASETGFRELKTTFLPHSKLQISFVF